jgi:hypothetical protein
VTDLDDGFQVSEHLSAKKAMTSRHFWASAACSFQNSEAPAWRT